MPRASGDRWKARDPRGRTGSLVRCGLSRTPPQTEGVAHQSAHPGKGAFWIGTWKCAAPERAEGTLDKVKRKLTFALDVNVGW
jgi:hypothetical protein